MSRQSSSIPVLMYHHVSPSGGPHCVHPDRFREQLGWLRREGIKLLKGGEFYAYCRGEWKPDGRAVLLTFDDGWLDNWVHALPALQAFDAPAVFFVISSWPGAADPRMGLQGSGWTAPQHRAAMAAAADATQRDSVTMRWSELLAARDSGLVELQSHSHGHGSWWRGGGEDAVLDVVATDLQQSIVALQAQTGERPLQLCWPRGEFNAGMLSVANKLGFSVQHSTLRGANEFGSAGQRLVRRLHVEDRPLAWFQSRISMYSRRYHARALGWCHQELFRQRQRRLHAAPWRRCGGLGQAPWRLV